MAEENSGIDDPLEIVERLLEIRKSIKRPDIDAKMRRLRTEVCCVSEGRLRKDQAERLVGILCLPVSLNYREKMALEALETASIAKENLALAELLSKSPRLHGMLGTDEFFFKNSTETLAQLMDDRISVNKKIVRLNVLPEMRKKKKERIIGMLSLPSSTETLVHAIERDHLVLDACKRLEEKIDYCLSKIKEKSG
jgi:hypothetical protein